MDSVLNEITSLMAKFPSYAPFFTIIIVMSFILYKAHVSSDQKFKIYDLIEDKDTQRGSLEKVGMLTAMLSLTWWFIDLAAQGKVTVDDVMAYGGIMGLAKIASSWLSAKYGQPTPAAKED